MAGVSTPYLVEQTLLGIATESTYGTAATIGAGAYIYVTKAEAKPESKAVAREHKYGQLAPLADAAGDTIWSLDIEGEYQTSGSVGSVVAPISAIEQAAGLSVSASNYFMEHTASANFPSVGKSATVKVHMRDNVVTLVGVYGNLVETYMAGDIVRFKFSGKGIWAGNITGSSAWPVATSIGDRYVKVLPTTMSVHSYTAEVGKVEVDYGNTVEAVLSAGEVFGYSKVIITKRNPTVKFDAVMDASGTHDFIGRMVAKTTGSLNLQAGTAAGNIVQYTASAVQYRTVDIGERNGIYVYNVEANVVGTFNKNLR